MESHDRCQRIRQDRYRKGRKARPALCTVIHALTCSLTFSQLCALVLASMCQSLPYIYIDHTAILTNSPYRLVTAHPEGEDLGLFLISHGYFPPVTAERTFVDDQADRSRISTAPVNTEGADPMLVESFSPREIFLALIAITDALAQFGVIGARHLGLPFCGLI